MTVQITIRNVPLATRDALALRAARQRQSMQEFLAGELERLAALPSAADWVATARAQKAERPVELSPGEIVRHRNAERR